MATAGEATLRAGTTELLVRRVEGSVDSERVFVDLYGDSPNAFWLDSSRAGTRGRFSFLGDAGGPLSALVTYDVEERLVRVARRDGGVKTRPESIFDFLSAALPDRRSAAPELPFELDCGLVGYLGYELKADCGAAAPHRSSTPDAALVFADRLVAFDHEEGCIYLVALTTLPPELHQLLGLAGGEVDAVQSAERWIEETGHRLEALPPLDGSESQGPVELRLRRSEESYLDDVIACKRYLAAGDSYEICLTDRLVGEASVDPLMLYRSLRRANPAPFSAYLRFGDLAVLSSSPERFLAVDRDGGVEARPIKGTSRRGAGFDEDARLERGLRGDPKSRAENVTIVDLVRNDLGRVCEAGSVEVSELAQVESFETVHQLVSCVRGRLQKGLGVPDCVRACFPPGSMTGAPKLRTMEILDQLEAGARGVYSGAIGYFGLGGGADLSVAIRTIVLEGERLSIGAGGAVLVDSDPRAELDEMLLKARAVTAAFTAGPGSGSPISLPSRPRTEQEPWP